MEFITTTQLRTNSSSLVKQLKSGDAVKLIHRSQVIGQINPSSTSATKIFDAKKFGSQIKTLNLPKLDDASKKTLYAEAMKKKHG